MPHWVETTLVVVHVLGATVWVGGTVALTFIAVPAIRLLTGEPRATAMRALGERWRPIGWGALIVHGRDRRAARRARAARERHRRRRSSSG